MVSGFHQVVVYDPGTKPEDIVVPSSGTFINDLTNVFYLGIPPQGGPPPGTPPTTNPFNGSNRQESVSFSDQGTYLGHWCQAEIFGIADCIFAEVVTASA